MAMVSNEIKAKAEKYHGDEICREKIKLWLEESEVPIGLLPMEGVLECGYERESGFMWIIQKKKKDHYFEKIGRLVSYATEVSSYVEKRKLKKVTGVKAKEFLIWITPTELYVDNKPNGKVTFKTSTGLSRSFPVSAFEVEEKK